MNPRDPPTMRIPRFESIRQTIIYFSNFLNNVIYEKTREIFPFIFNSRELNFDESCELSSKISAEVISNSNLFARNLSKGRESL